MATTAKAEHGVEGTLGADLVSQYIWRGTDCGSAAIQPTLGIAWKGLSLTAWGSVGITSADDTRELDLTVGYSTGGFNVGVTDYWFSSGNEAAAGRYFLYKNSKTNHLFEGNVGYDFGPLSMQWYTLFAGNDYKANGVSVPTPPTWSSPHRSNSQNATGRLLWVLCHTPAAVSMAMPTDSLSPMSR